jgi:hypothetical protein
MSCKKSQPGDIAWSERSGGFCDDEVEEYEEFGVSENGVVR